MVGILCGQTISAPTENGRRLTAMDEFMKAACWIVCPMCDEPKCVGRFDCPEIKEWAERKRKEYGDGNG